MMKGSETKIFNFMEGANKRFCIPIYQRKYSWTEDNCRQLYNDLLKVARNRQNSHFFGSVVSSVIGHGATTEYHIIDGQQHLTTVTLLLLAIRNLLRQNKITAQGNLLDEQINDRFLVNKWAEKGHQIKLRLGKGDHDALDRLFGEEENWEPSSLLTLNYRFFCEQILKKEVSVDELYTAIGKLEIIIITLEYGDNAQLIFESLNSTGLALTEGDKIRNFILMGQKPKDQERFYEDYWAKIERCTENDASAFIRDYLSIKQQVTPKISNVYRAFKDYVQKSNFSIESLLEDMRRYARFYEKLLKCESKLNDKKLDDCLFRLSRLDIVVIRPFLMEVLNLNQNENLSVDELREIFLITENYLARRMICETPTNSLSKIFLNLNGEILRYENNSDNYVQKFIYALLSKKYNGRFPNDEEFAAALRDKQIYPMRRNYKEYLFERFENYGTVETKDIYTHLDNEVYSIEHIMPQRLNPEWEESLGTDAKEIHGEWLHRLANLTLTGYNPQLGNKSFAEKRDAEKYGYKNSGLRMNQKISHKESWGLAELEERNEELVALAKTIWIYPRTTFAPAEPELESCILADDSVDPTGRNIVKYSYQNTEQLVSSWAEMFEHIVKFLHQKDKSILSGLAYDTINTAGSDLTQYVSCTTEKLRSALKIEDHIYIESNTNTLLKLSILRKMFELYGVNAGDLVFYLKIS